MIREFHRWLDRREPLRFGIAVLAGPLLVTAAMHAPAPWNAAAAAPVALFMATRYWYLYGTPRAG